MTGRLVTLFVSTLLLAAIGCRNSTKTASAAPSPSPTPAVQAATPIAPVASPAPAEASPGPPIQVTPPASFSADQLNGRTTQFIIQGHSGQFLRAKLSGGDQAVSAQLLGSAPRPITALWNQGDCSGNFVYQLPETGSYQVEFRPAVRQMGIDFSLLAGDDPMVNPGIKPDQISIDFGSFAGEAKMKLVPFGQWRGCSEDDSQPTHWELEGGRVDFQIMQVAGYKKALEPDSSMARLESTLRNGEMAPIDELPYPSESDAGLNLWGRQRFLQWDGWKGISWVGAFAQDYLCGFDGKNEFLAYVVQAISDDGRFFVMMRRGISNPQVARRLDQKCNTGPNDKGSKEWDSFFHKDMQATFDKEMSAADPASFTPNLDELDAVIKSLKLKR